MRSGRSSWSSSTHCSSCASACSCGASSTRSAASPRLGRRADGGADRAEARARIKAAEAALPRLEELVEDGAVYPQTAERLRGALGFRRDRFRARLDENGDGSIEERSVAYQRVMRE